MIRLVSGIRGAGGTKRPDGMRQSERNDKTANMISYKIKS